MSSHLVTCHMLWDEKRTIKWWNIKTHMTRKHADSTAEGGVELPSPHHNHSTSHHSPFPLPLSLPLKYILMSTFTWYILAGQIGFIWELSLYNQTWNMCAFLPGKRRCHVFCCPENGEDLGVFIMWVTSGEGWRGQPQVTLNMVKRSCLQCLEYGLAVKHSNKAD